MLSKNLLNFDELSQLVMFSTDNVADKFNIQKKSASVLLSRYSRKGIVYKLKNDLYITSRKLKNISREELYAIASFLQVPSYISFMTALSYYEITSQVIRNMIECVSTKRSIEYPAGKNTFTYYKLKKTLFYGFEKKDGYFIASKEKAFADTAYLYSFGKYRFDLASIDMSKLDKKKLNRIITLYPEKSKKIIRKLWNS